MNGHPEVIIIPAFLLTLAYIVSLALSTWRGRQRLKTVMDLHTRLIDRLGSIKDFTEFVQTDAGARFMRDLGSEPVAGGAHDRILRAAQLGVVLACLGLGLLLLSFFSPSSPDQARRAYDAVGVIALSLGVGFVLSSAAAYRLAARLGLLERAPDGRAPVGLSNR
jgi:hypothetical protein